ncbi:PVC-type heme-binding CxxCH protein [Tautonia plasticadhaerens]|uniref:HEAT repeat protein n=1 Tax=Tautonia plasticadhaerens TaxID=2527974 RepID=A0A518HBC2_9BACT|nr:PVC-type heme-binding CxxCH protein [Tautonia plasticadhaerens]QDV38155.1 HEAT repeat protein [Tautonia plasticadhaerens]
MHRAPTPSRAPSLGLWLLGLLALIGPRASALAADPDADADPDRFEPQISPASDEPSQAIAGFRIPDGFSVRPWAAEPMLANPVAFAVDDRGRVYVAETFRHGQGVTDTRGHMYWLDDDLASTSVEDRVAMYRKHFDDPTFRDYGVAPDRLRLLVDADGDGTADEATVFASGFDDVAAGIGAGVLARGEDVWYACIPDLWLLRDTDGDRVADERRALHSGYGVHVGFLGHDLHGLIFGPDGKLYFSIGDRGFNVETTEGDRLAIPHTGSVLRCDPDGSNLEVFASGLRNPQELAFDRFGNLFTVDNNSDGGDRARLIDLVEGGDSGWHMGWQYLTEPVARGAWNAENLWKPESEGNDAAYLLPPLANLSDGPSGLSYNPGGAAMPGRYDDHFFLADFRGTAGNSGIRSFAVEPDGASFRPVDEHQFFWSILATDVDFPPSGGLFVSDWVEGWDKPTKGRIYHLTPSESDDPTVAEVARLLGGGFDQRPIDELVGLLGHADQRIRQRSQFALADRGARSLGSLISASESDNEMARLHAVWALGQIGRGMPQALSSVVDRLKDPSEHVRGQAARVLGDGRADFAVDALIGRLDDPAPRVRMYAAIALGKLGDGKAIGPVAEMIRRNADADPYLRHAGVMGLLGAASNGDLDRLAGDDSEAVRLATLLAYRRNKDPEVARFLDDPEPRLVLEAARAINDAEIGGATAKLATLDVAAGMPAPLIRRVLNANLRVGGPEAAGAVARVAAAEGMPEEIRAEALAILADWAEPSGRDRIVGLWRPVPSRPADAAAEALRPVVADLLSEAPDRVRLAAARAVGALKLEDAGPALFELSSDGGLGAEARVAAIRALEAIGDARLAEVARRSTTDPEAMVRTEGLRLLSNLDPEEALPILDAVLRGGTTPERQGALSTLGGMESDQADRVLAAQLDALLAGEVPMEIRLDLIEAAGERSAAEVRQKLARYEASRPPGDPLAAYLEALEGGDVRRGRRIFFERTEAQCQRCHQVDGQGGEVGPALSEIGKTRDRSYLLRSIVAPDAEIAEGFETLVVATGDGQVLTGIVKEDTGDALALMDAEGKVTTVAKSDIEESRRGVSAMPADLITHLSRRDLRDLVEYLATRKGESRRGGHGR